MKINVVAIGNSKGIRIPRSLLELCRIRTEVDLEVKGKTLVIHPIQAHRRAGWDKAFQAMHEKREDQLLVDDRIDLEMGSWEW